MRVLAFALILMTSATPAQAYMGPGAGLALIGSLFALFAAIGIGALGLVWYPLKRLIRMRRETQEEQDPSKGSEGNWTRHPKSLYGNNVPDDLRNV